MARLSTSSTSSTSGLGNTSLRGFGGMASGLDRDSFIEALTQTTSSKITKAKQKITTLEWRQEAYKSLSDKALDLQDKYTSYASSNSIVNRASYLASTLTAGGDETNAKFVKATGNSDLLSHLTIKGAAAASSASLVSDAHTGATASTKLSELGLTDDALKTLTINGKSIDGLTADSTISDLVSKVNSSDAGVKAKFLASSGKLALLSNTTGSDGKIEVDSGAGTTLFGGTFTAGQDAKLTVSYGNSITEELTSKNNTFDVDGVKVTVSGDFGYSRDETTGATTFDASKAGSVTFTKSPDSKSIVENVKNFIKDYNAMVEEVNKHVTTRPSSDYEPLTEAQEDEMTDKEIEKWNEKAKEGILYNESAVTDFAFSIHSFMNNAISELSKSGISYTDLQNMGISLSDDYADGGQIKFDEDKFKAAVESDPNKVADVFSGTSKSTGLAKSMENMLTPYATKYATRNGGKGSYGRLIEAAGSDKLSLTKTSNTIYNQIKSQNSTISDLQAQLKIEQNRYIEQFSNLESLINNMNTQASYISGLSG